RRGHDRPPLPPRPQRRGQRRRHARRQVGADGLYERLELSPWRATDSFMTVSPGIFKAYDVRGLYPSELDETTARAIGAAFVAYLDAKRIAVSRDMRVSSPSLAKAFIEGARGQGADVVDYGMAGTDMLYFA